MRLQQIYLKVFDEESVIISLVGFLVSICDDQTHCMLPQNYRRYDEIFC